MWVRKARSLHALGDRPVTEVRSLMFPVRRFRHLYFHILVATTLVGILLFLYPLLRDAAQAQSQTPGIKTDRGVYPEGTPPTLPSAGGKIIDPVFGTQIM